MSVEAIHHIEAPADVDRLVRIAIGLTVCLLAVRLILTARMGLVFDEAYYWVWSKNLAFGYYDHPPMVAYFIWLGTLVFGDNFFAIRVVGAVSFAADVWLIYQIVLVLFQDRGLAAWSAILLNATLLAAGSMIITPDQPLVLFWLVTVYGLSRIATGGRRQWWLLVGVGAGLAVVSKYTAFFLGISIVAWLVAVPSLRRELLRPWLYAAGLLAAVICSPVLVWNADHQWISFVKQFGRIGAGEFRPQGILEYVGGYVGLATPFVALLSIGGFIACVRRAGWWRDPPIALLVATVAPLGLYFISHAFHQKVEGNWIAPLVLTGVIFAAFGIRLDGAGLWRRAMGLCRRIAVPFGVALTLCFYALALVPDFPAGPEIDVLSRFKGWDNFAQSADAVRRAEGADYILGGHYGSYSELRFYLRDVPVFPLGDEQRWMDFPKPSPALTAGSALYVGEGPKSGDRLGSFFNQVRRVADVERRVDGQVIPYAAFVVSDPKP